MDKYLGFFKKTLAILTVVFIVVSSSCDQNKMNSDDVSGYIGVQDKLEKKYDSAFMFVSSFTDDDTEKFVFSSIKNPKIRVVAFYNITYDPGQIATVIPFYKRKVFCDNLPSAIREFYTEEYFSGDELTVSDGKINEAVDQIYNCLYDIYSEYNRHGIDTNFYNPYVEIKVTVLEKSKVLDFSILDKNDILNKIFKMFYTLS